MSDGSTPGSDLLDDFLDDDGPTTAESTSEPGSLLIRPEREIPGGLSGKVVGWLGGWMILGFITGGIFLGVGWSSHQDYLETRAMLYQGQIADAQVGVLSDDEDTWAIANVSYRGQIAKAVPVEVTKKELNEIVGGKVKMIQVAFWAEEFKLDGQGKLQNEGEFVSVEWIKAESPAGSFLWAYYLAVVLLVIFGFVGVVGMLRRKRRYEHGEEVWAQPISEVTYDSENSRYSTSVSYEVKGDRQVASVTWNQAANPMVHAPTGKLLGLVDPKRPGKFYVLSESEQQALAR